MKLALSNRQVIDITCKGVINIGGETDYRDAPSGWLSVCQDADVIFYMMTVNDLAEKRFLKGRRIRQDLDWLQTAMPHLKQGALIHILINKIDEKIESHTDYQALAEELAQELGALDRTVQERAASVRGEIYRRDADLDEEQADLHARDQYRPSFRLFRVPRDGEAQEGGVIAMRAYWILPNRDQSDDILASDGETIGAAATDSRPEAAPGGVFARRTDGAAGEMRTSLRARFCLRNGSPTGMETSSCFRVSTPAGVDSSGRVVHLGLLFILEPHERPRFDLPYAGLPEEDQAYAQRSDSSNDVIRSAAISGRRAYATLANCPPAARPATNVALERSVVRFHSLYIAGPGGLIRKAVHWRKWRGRDRCADSLRSRGVWLRARLQAWPADRRLEW